MSCALHSARLPVELTNGNEGRTKFYWAAAKYRKEVEANLRELGHEREPFPHQVEVRVTRILGKGQRLMDPSSLGRGTWKEIEDALVALGWFHDDSAKWISEVRFFQDATRRSEGPAILVACYRPGVSPLDLLQ